MANVELKVMDKYTDDFGTEYENYNVKFERGMIERVDTGWYKDRDPDKRSISCGSARYFTPRRIKVVFTDGKSVELPVPSIGDVEEYVGKVLNATDLACASLIGESWRVIPPGILGGDYANDGLDGADKPESEKVRFKYRLDGDKDIFSSVTLEKEPDDLFDAQKSCLDIVTGGVSVVCSVGGGVKHRHFKGYRLNTATDGKFGRKIIVSDNDTGKILTCGKDLMKDFNCLGYEGESIDNLNDFYNKGASI